MSKIYYFAYGSNLHPLRLQRRIPSAVVIETWMLPAYRLAFHKLGTDNSAKCNIVSSESKNDGVYGVIYSMQEKEKSILDAIEGNGYITSEYRWKDARCFFYVAEDNFIDDSLRAYSWYWQLVWQGAKFHGFPLSYMDEIKNVRTKVDLDIKRLQYNSELLDDMHAYDLENLT